MATPTPSSTPPTGPNSSTTATIAAGKQMKKDQGDYNDILKESVNLVAKLSKSYSDIEARLSSMDKSSVNLKRINNEIFKAQTQAYVANKKLAQDKDNLDAAALLKVSRYAKSQDLVASLEKKMQTARRSGNIADIKFANDRLNKAIKLNEGIKTRLSIEEMGAVQNAEANRIAQEAVVIANKHLATEKQVSKSIGLSGKAMGAFATKLGLGGDIYGDMVEHARELQKVGQKLTFFDKVGFLRKAAVSAVKEGIKDPLIAIPAVYKAAAAGMDKIGAGAAKAGNFVKGLSGDSGNIVGGLTSGFSGMLKNIPLVGGMLGGVVDGFSALLDMVIGVDDAIIKAGRSMGMSSGAARDLNRHFQDVAFNSGNVLVTSKKLLQTQVELSAQLGINNQLSDKNLETAIMMKDVMGLEASTIAEIAQSSALSGKSQEGVAKSVIAQVQGLKNATGISLNFQQTIKEASSLGGYLGLTFAKYPGQLAKSLVVAKSFGLELKQLDSMADSFLDFESSISNEFEAQLLTGKNINLQKAREAFLNNDLAGAAAEISSQVGSSSDFMKMNRIQAESLAKSMGMSRDALGDMLKKQEFLGKIGAKDTDSSTKQLELARAKFKTQGEMNEALGEEGYQNLVTLSTQEKLAGNIEKIKQSIIYFVERSGLIEKIQNFVSWLTEPGNMKGVLQTIKGAIANAITFFAGIIESVMRMISHLPFTDKEEFQGLADQIHAGAANAAASIMSVGEGGGASNAISVSEKSAASSVHQGQQMAHAAGIESKAGSQVNLEVHTRVDPNDAAKVQYQVYNKSTHKSTDWQAGLITF
jgi:hypothetical protein